MDIANLVKDINKKIYVLLGGPESTFSAEEIFKENKNVDFIIKGEGEKTFEELLISLMNNESDFSNIKGLVWRKNGEIISNKEREYLTNLDLSPLPARHYFPMKKYHGGGMFKGLRTLNMVTSRGCPYACAYCSSLLFGKKFRYHSSERVCEEMNILKKDYNCDEIHFYDDVFTLNKERVFELCDKIIKENLKMPWICLTRVDAVNEELLRAMKSAGCYQIWLGVESGVQRLIDLLRKNITLEQAFTAFSLCKKLGIMTYGLFMLGLPTETKDDSEETIKTAIKLDPNFAQFTYTTPIPNTHLYKLAKESGKIVEQEITKYNFFSNVVYLPEGRTIRELKNTTKRAYRKFYLRYGFLKRTLPFIIRYPLRKWISFIVTGVQKLIF